MAGEEDEDAELEDEDSAISLITGLDEPDGLEEEEAEDSAIMCIILRTGVIDELKDELAGEDDAKAEELEDDSGIANRGRMTREDEAEGDGEDEEDSDIIIRMGAITEDNDEDEDDVALE